jgi:polyisoprenoid-binding protein YceI
MTMSNLDTQTNTQLEALTPGAWKVDTTHSTVGFTVRHMMVAKVRGHFPDFEAEITVDNDKLLSSVTATVQMSSITTGDEGRDGHLRNADFFDVDTHPTMTFTSTSVESDGGEYTLNGDLTIHGVTKPVSFELEFEGVVKDPWGGTRVGFTALTEISRKDFGLEYNAALEAGGVVVGDKVKIQLDIEAVKA